MANSHLLTKLSLSELFLFVAQRTPEEHSGGEGCQLLDMQKLFKLFDVTNYQHRGKDSFQNKLGLRPR